MSDCAFLLEYTSFLQITTLLFGLIELQWKKLFSELPQTSQGRDKVTNTGHQCSVTQIDMYLRIWQGPRQSKYEAEY